MISRGLLHLESASDDRAAEPAPPPLPVRDAAIAGRLTPWHEFDDSAGVSWRVFELPAGSAGHSSWSASLLFESDTAVRRARNFPPRWAALSALDLERISRER
jgi:hypothetical protein